MLQRLWGFFGFFVCLLYISPLNIFFSFLTERKKKKQPMYVSIRLLVLEACTA